MMTLTNASRSLILFYAIANVSGRKQSAASCSGDGDPPVPAMALLHQRRWLFFGDSSEKDSEEDSEQPQGNGKLDKFDRNYVSDANNPMDDAATENLTDNEALSGKKKEATDLSESKVDEALSGKNKEANVSSESKVDKFDRNYLSDADNPMDDVAAKNLTDNEALSGKNHEAADSSGKPEANDASPKEEPPAATSAPATSAAPANTQVPAPTPTKAPAAAAPAPTEMPAPGEAPSGSNVTSPPNTTTATTTTLGHTVALCGTRNDPSVSNMSLYYTAAPEGTPCVFGADDRDEGAHCIFDDVKYGAFGWCWTNVQMDTWGSCNATCPLFGPLKVLEDKLDRLRQSLPAPGNATAAAPSNATA